MIPKVIHYCWFGRKPKPKKVENCIQSWKTLNPDFQIIEWNEDNFDCFANNYLEWCFRNEKWAFLSDLARLQIIYENGGIYLDTDVELVKSIDPLLEHSAFFCFENDKNVATGLGFGAVPKNPVILSMCKVYDGFEQKESITPVNCPALNTKALIEYGLVLNGQLQTIESDAIVYPKEYFNPYDDRTGNLDVTDNTYGIHWYFKSALPMSSIIRSRLTKPFHRWFGIECFNWIKGILTNH